MSKPLLDNICRFCLDDEFDNDDAMLRRCILPCGHVFHVVCLDSICGHPPQCPACGMQLRSRRKRENVRVVKASCCFLC